MGSARLPDRERAARLASLLFRLRSLDQVWTTYLATTKVVPDEEIACLQALTDEMRQMLVCVPTEARWLASLIDESSDEIEHQLTQVVQAAPVETEAKQAFYQEVAESRKLVPFLRSRIDRLIAESDSEATTLAAKMHTISQGKYVPGDVGFLCAVGAALAVAGALTADPVAVGVGVLVVVAEC
jgi:predicted ester cyclase